MGETCPMAQRNRKRKKSDCAAKKDQGLTTVEAVAKVRDGRHRKRKRQGPADVVELDTAEKLRREQQRILQAAAREAQAAGRPYVKAKKLRAAAAAAAAAATVLGKRKSQVAIIPIYWSTEGREGEKDAVIGFAKELMIRLEGAGVVCRTDTRDNLKPSQKMKYWEKIGVKVRLEVGPEELKSKKCIIAIPKGPGEVAARTRVAAGDQLTKKVRQALKNLGVKVETPPAHASVNKNKKTPQGAIFQNSSNSNRSHDEKRSKTDGGTGDGEPSTQSVDMRRILASQTDVRDGNTSKGVGTNGVANDPSGSSRAIKDYMVRGDDLRDHFDVSIDCSDDGNVTDEAVGEERVAARNPTATHHLSGDDLMDSFVAGYGEENPQEEMKKKRGGKQWKKIGKGAEGDALRNDHNRNVEKKGSKVVKF